MGPFTYTSRGKVMTMSYHEVPPDVLEQQPELVEWARRAIRASIISHSTKTMRRAK